MREKSWSFIVPLILVAAFVLSGCRPGLYFTPTPVPPAPTPTAAFTAVPAPTPRPSPTVSPPTSTPLPTTTPSGLVVQTPYESAELGFRLLYPTGWVYEEQYGSVVFAAHRDDIDTIMGMVDGRIFGVLVGTDMTQADTPQAALKDLLDDLDVSGENIVVGEIQTDTLDTEAAASVLLSFTPAGEDINLKMYLLAAFHAEQSYLVIATAPVERWEATWPAYQEMLRSFKFVERPATPTPLPVTPTSVPSETLVVQSQYENANLGFRLLYPIGWIYKEGADSVDLAANKDDLNGDGLTDGRVFRVFTGPGLPTTGTPQDALRVLLNALVTYGSAPITIIGEIQTTTMDTEVAAGVLLLGTGAREDILRKMYLLIAFHEEQPYAVMAFAPAERWDATWPAYQEMLQSFQFLKPAAEGAGGGFAPYQPPTVTVSAQYAGAEYALPLDLAQVEGLTSYDFSPAQEKLLADNGFVARPGDWKEFFVLYEQARYDDRPAFITSDSLLHVYHLMFDKVLRTAEVKYFSKDLQALDEAMYRATEAQAEALKGTEWEPAALRNVGYFCVALRLMGAYVAAPEPIKGAVDEELALIEKHEGWAISPLWGNKYKEDYSQYIPRGHYTKNDTLQTYFKVMMWHGRLTFRQNFDDETASALLLCLALRDAKTDDGTPALALWQHIYEPTVFFVGRSDDLGYYEYYPLVEEIYGRVSDPKDLMDETKFAQFREEAKKLEGPKINSMFVLITEDREEVTKGFRFMGQRFVLDAYIFQQLIWREVGTLERPRMLPKGLDVFAALGSQEAYGILKDMGETEYENYDKQMSKVRDEVASVPESDWTQNLYWSWLYCLRPLADAKSESYPAWMRTSAWTRKDLHSALGSWTELKHDTILYAKQVYAEAGGAPEPESKLVGWVEPNPHVFARLAGLTRMTIDGLQSRGLLDDADGDALVRLERVALRCQSIAEKELRGEPVSEDDILFMRFYGRELEQLTIAAADRPESGKPVLDEHSAAVVADVATDGVNGLVLEEAVGRIDEIYVVVQNPGETPYVCQGGIFSYYEFPWPMSDRLTDEKWRQMLDEGKVPARPGWIASFFDVVTQSL